MLHNYFFKIIDFFIKDRDGFVGDELYLKRLIVIILSIGGLAAAVSLVLQQFGLLNVEYNIFIFISSIVALAFFKKIGSNTIPILIIIVFATGTLISNINSTGNIFSYNTKWFTLILILFTFIHKRWMGLMVIAIMAYQSYCYFGLPLNSEFILTQELKRDTYIDNLIYFLFTFFFISISFNFLKGKNKRIDMSNEIISKKSILLKQSNKELERFAHIVSHDLKTPLRNIASFIMLLDREMGLEKTPKAKEYLEIIKNGSKKLDTIVDDVLVFSKVSSNKEAQELIDLNEVIEEIKAMTHENVKKRDASVDVKNHLPQLIGKRNLVLLAIKNIIENGLKYNEASKPRIEIDCSKDDEYYRLSIKDNGMGIEEQYHDSIFEMFSRLHGESEYEGTGLGLAFSQKIMLDMRGKLTLESKIGDGTTFYLWFPLEGLERINGGL